MRKNGNECLYKGVCENAGSLCGKCPHKYDTVINQDLYNALKKDLEGKHTDYTDIDEGLKADIVANKRR